jgi:superfamily II DNA/RNA helicase
MISTDLGSRGLDFDNVEHIIMYDFPLDAISFLHRVGRTGRIGKKGLVTLIVREKDEFLYNKIISVIAKNTTLDEIFSKNRSLRKSSQSQSSARSTTDEDEESK